MGEARLRVLEQGGLTRLSGTGKQKAKFDVYQNKSEVRQYPTAADSTFPPRGRWKPKRRPGLPNALKSKKWPNLLRKKRCPKRKRRRRRRRRKLLEARRRWR